MLCVGIFAAKAQLSQLVERVAQGEEVLVTRHGKPVARLVAPEASSDVAALAEWAADLEMAMRLNCALATQDKALAKAAKRLGFLYA